MTKLGKKFFIAIESFNDDILKNYNDEILHKIINFNGGNNEMTEEETQQCILLGNAMVEEMVRIKNLKTDIEDIKNGNKPDFFHHFVKDICSKTTV